MLMVSEASLWRGKVFLESVNSFASCYFGFAPRLGRCAPPIFQKILLLQAILSETSGVKSLVSAVYLEAG